MIRKLKKIYHKIFPARTLKREIQNLQTRVQELQAQVKVWKTDFYPPGHYYNPFPQKEEIKNNESTIFNKEVSVIGGIDLNTNYQLDLLSKLSEQYKKINFPEQLAEGYRYFYQNQFFSYSDAISLSTLMLHFKPKRIIEVGSGYSSAVMLDINQQFLNNATELIFIEPYPEERLNQLVQETNNFQLRKEFIQDIPLSFYDQLEENDILFIDSSHVSKTYSDVNHILFNILPRLKKGVIVHFHDVFYPFEYPKEWIYNDRGWNEAYILRAFLQFNTSFSIELFTSYLESTHKSWYENHMPLCLKNHEVWTYENGSKQLLDTAGQSIYIRKVN